MALMPPHSLDAEGSVLSAIMFDEKRIVLDDVRPLLGDGSVFYSLANKLIYRAIIALDEAGKEYDTVTILRYLHDNGHEQTVGGSPYLLQIINETPATSNVKEHARIVRDLSRVRRAIALAQAAAANGYTHVGADEDNVQKYLEDLESDVADLAHVQQEHDLRPLDDVATEVDVIIRAAMGGTGVTGTPTGYALLDERTSGVHDGDLAFIAGRPGMGKTAFAIDMAMRIAKLGYAVPFFSLEMPDVQLGMRILSSESRVDLNVLRKGKLSREDWRDFTNALQAVQSLPVFIDDQAALSPLEIRARIKRLKREIDAGKHSSKVTKARIGAAFVDYVQLVTPVRQTHSREQDVASIGRDLKLIAKMLGIPVIALCQLNRNVEARTGDKRPQLSDLRESGSLEQEADLVLFLFRPAYYDKTNDPSLKGWAEVIIGKQRNGPTGTVRVAFQERCARFDNLEKEDIGVLGLDVTTGFEDM